MQSAASGVMLSSQRQATRVLGHNHRGALPGFAYAPVSRPDRAPAWGLLGIGQSKVDSLHVGNSFRQGNAGFYLFDVGVYSAEPKSRHYVVGAQLQ